MAEKKKLIGQFALLMAVCLLFAGFNAGVWTLITSRCKGNFGEGLDSKMIVVEYYLPFGDDTKICKTDAHDIFAGVSAEELPVLDGATALLPVYSAAAHALYPESACGFSTEDGAFLPESRVQYRNTVGAYKAIVDGCADVVFCAGPSAEQLAYAEQNGVELELTPIGREAFVFFVNSGNPVDGLTSDEIRGIYTGEYTNWLQLGGANRAINAMQRKEGSGSQTMMLRFMGGTEMKKRPFNVFGGAIGFSFRWYLDGIVGNADVKMLAVDGFEPTPENIRSSAYPVTSQFYAVTRAGDEDPNTQKVVDWLLSEEGQRLVEESGYVGV